MYDLLSPSSLPPETPPHFLDGPGADVLTPSEAAAMLRLSLNTTYTYLRLGVIPGERVGRRWIVPRTRLEKWLAGASAGGL